VSCFEEEEEEEEEEEIRVIYLVDIEDWGGRWSQCSCREYATLRSWYTERNDTEVRRVSGDMGLSFPRHGVEVDHERSSNRYFPAGKYRHTGMKILKAV
jgi:hypothetical protein